MRLVAAEGYAAASADVQAQLGRLNATRRRHAGAVRDPGHRARRGWIRGPPRLAAAPPRERRRERLDPDRRRDLDRVSQGSARRRLARRSGDEALSRDPGEIRKRRQSRRDRPRSRDGGRARDGPGAEGRRRDPDACRRRGADSRSCATHPTHFSCPGSSSGRARQSASRSSRRSSGATRRARGSASAASGTCPRADRERFSHTQRPGSIRNVS